MSGVIVLVVHACSPRRLQERDGPHRNQEPFAMDARRNPEPIMRPPNVALRGGKKPLLLFLGAASGLALLGLGAASNWEVAEVASGAVLRKVSAAIGTQHDQRAQATTESVGLLEPQAQAATLTDRSAILAVPPITAERPRTVAMPLD